MSEAPTASLTDADLVIEALYQVAANPAAWGQLIAVLDPQGLEEAPAGAAAELRRSAEIARLQSGPGEGPLALAQATVGWVVVGHSGKVVSSDAQGREALEALGGRVKGDGRVAFEDAANEDSTRLALAAARVAGHPIILRLTRPGFDSPSFVYAASADALPGFAAGQAPPALSQKGAAALVFPATDAAARLWTSVRRSFGLTAAEVRLAQYLRDGRSLQEAARDLGVSINTVRNQLRSVFDKMGLQRQSELVVALADLTALAGAIGAEAQGQAPKPLAEAPGVQAITLADGRRLAYRDYGDPAGKVLLSFHEGMGSSLLPPRTDALAAELGLRVVAVDRPGFGQSDPRGDYNFEAVAQDMEAFCDRLGLGRVRIGGTLSGAAAALYTAARLGERVEFVFLTTARAPHRAAAASAPRTLLTQFRARMEANPWVLEAFYGILRVRMSHRLVRSLLRSGAAHSTGDQAYLAAHPELADYVWGYTAEALGRDNHGPVDEMLAFRKAPPVAPAGLSAPVVVWHGEEDALAPLPDLLALLGERTSELKVIPGIGHLMCAKHWPEILARAAGSPPGP